MTHASIEYQLLETALERCGSTWNPGQVHGYLCSRLSIAGLQGIRDWRDQVLEDTNADAQFTLDCATLLASLGEQTWRQLAERQSDFDLFLPDDGESTASRADAMGRWCEGFLQGLVAEKNAEALNARLAADPVADIIKDMLQITRVSGGDDEDEEGDESALTELVEYLRVATQLIYEELAAFRGPATEAPAAPTVH